MREPRFGMSRFHLLWGGRSYSANQEMGVPGAHFLPIKRAFLGGCLARLKEIPDDRRSTAVFRFIRR